MITGIINIVKSIFTLTLALVCIVAVYFVMHITNDDLTVTGYSIEAKVKSNFRIVQISDFHNAEYGNDNIELVELVKAQNPDIIILSGDMINGQEEDTETAEKLVRELSKITAVYFGYGNHEYKWEKTFDKKIDEIFTNAGARVLNNTYEDIELKGNHIRIGGYMGYYRIPWMFNQDEREYGKQYRFFDDFENTENYKILIDHIPTGWVDWEYSAWPVDLVFSGHYHGGQWVLPIYGPVYAPYIGYRPPYTKGVFKGRYATTVLSSGVGNEYWYLPRINNFPEIVVLDVKSRK